MASKQQLAFYRTFAQHGSGKALVEIEPKDLLLLIHIAYSDINPTNEPFWYKKEFIELARKEFYSITPKMTTALPTISVDDAIDGLIKCGATDANNIIYLYLKNLAELYRRRFKFYHILKTQPFPSSDQIGPRCLLEYGNCADVLLFNWMCWRKLIYDIDNRSAQETGYLFEPILASCLGGEPISAQKSPVKRVVDGKATKDGRQVDCYIADKKEVYELKLRVTIAASGQGRFNEEMTFPYEAKMAGLKPILVVFAPTPSPLLEKLKEEYENNGGQYAIGEDAWNLLKKRAGNEMGKYISKYIKPPISEMEKESIEHPYSVKLSAGIDTLVIEGEDGNSYVIERDNI